MKLDIGYVDDLKKCYSQQAKHFHNTRKKYRPEVDYIAWQIDAFFAKKDSSQGQEWASSQRQNTDFSQLQNRHYSLVDLWCGSGRLLEALEERTPESMEAFDCVWVDIAQGMIDLAQRTYPEHTFRCNDMHWYLESVPQESLDMVVGLASIQHIKGTHNQQELFYALYKALNRGWVAVLVNRSFSKRFLGKYYRNVVEAGWRSLFSSQRARNDLIIPRKDKAYQQNGVAYERMYHIYTLHELKKLATLSWFVVKESWYILQDWSIGTQPADRKHARNSFIVIEKAIS